MKHKRVPITRAKAKDEGRFSALAAVWEVVDRAGDRMMPGSFTETLRKWRKSGKRIPIVWSHQSSSPDSVIGSADPNEVRETSSGLQVDGTLDIEESGTARRAWQLLKSGAISGWSFGYIVEKAKRASDGVNELFAVELLELGPTISPANPETATLAVKAEASATSSDIDEKLIEEILAKAEAEEKRAERKARPIKVKTFRV